MTGIYAVDTSQKVLLPRMLARVAKKVKLQISNLSVTIYSGIDTAVVIYGRLIFMQHSHPI